MMTRPDMRTRQAKAAQAYMIRKGYGDIWPNQVIRIEGDLCWYFYYDLPDGCLELEVAWENDDWKYTVTTFIERGDATPGTDGR